VEIQRVFEACTPAQLAKKGLAVLGLTVAGMKTGAGGKRYLLFVFATAIFSLEVMFMHWNALHEQSQSLQHADTIFI
jgi:hypothetical protein